MSVRPEYHGRGPQATNGSDGGALLGRWWVSGVEPPIALFDAASPLMPSNGGADMVWASTLTGSGDFPLRLAGRQGENLIAEAR